MRASVFLINTDITAICLYKGIGSPINTDDNLKLMVVNVIVPGKQCNKNCHI
jgi:hypothetical protein